MYIHNSNSDLRTRAQKLRKNMTKEERHLWYDFLKTSPFNYKRQKIIGRYIVDFCCDNPKVIIELDGSQHFTSEQTVDYDEKRDRALLSLGYKILRFTNLDIHNNFRGVCDVITFETEKIKRGER